MTNTDTLTLKDIRASIGDTEVVKGVSLTLKPGELHVIMGKNGSGKSSLVNALMGHPKFTTIEGEMLLGATNILREQPNTKAKHGLFLSMQHLPAIDGITLAYFIHQVNKSQNPNPKPIMDFYNEAKEVARTIGIPEGLLDRPLHGGLSGGEKKQSEILQLLLLKPRFAFLDEIDSGLDIDALKCVVKGVGMLRTQGTAFVLITHYPTLLEALAPDHVHVMAGGSIVVSGGSELAMQVKDGGFSDLAL